MAESVSYFCVKNINMNQVVQCVKDYNPQLDITDNFYISENYSGVTVFTGNSSNEIWEALKTASILQTVFWIHVMTHEGSIWEYVAYHGSAEVDLFSVLRKYWSSDDQQEWIGNPQLIAQEMSIDIDSIINYYKLWDFDTNDNIVIGGKAYADDVYPYGDMYQCMDFIKKIKFPVPNIS